LVKPKLSLKSGLVKKTIHSTEYRELIQWLRKQRKQHGITMRELGDQVGVIHSWVGKIEQGERRLDLVEYIRVCDALQIDPHEGLELVRKHLSKQ